MLLTDSSHLSHPHIQQHMCHCWTVLRWCCCEEESNPLTEITKTLPAYLLILIAIMPHGNFAFAVTVLLVVPTSTQRWNTLWWQSWQCVQVWSHRTCVAPVPSLHQGVLCHEWAKGTATFKWKFLLFDSHCSRDMVDFGIVILHEYLVKAGPVKVGGGWTFWTVLSS